MIAKIDANGKFYKNGDWYNLIPEEGDKGPPRDWAIANGYIPRRRIDHWEDQGLEACRKNQLEKIAKARYDWISDGVTLRDAGVTIEDSDLADVPILINNKTTDALNWIKYFFDKSADKTKEIVNYKLDNGETVPLAFDDVDKLMMSISSRIQKGYDTESDLAKKIVEGTSVLELLQVEW